MALGGHPELTLGVVSALGTLGLLANQPGLGGEPVRGCFASQSASAFRRPHATRSRTRRSRSASRALRFLIGSGSCRSNAAIWALAISPLCNAAATTVKLRALTPDIHGKTVEAREIDRHVAVVSRSVQPLFAFECEQGHVAYPQPILVTFDPTGKKTKKPDTRKLVFTGQTRAQTFLILEHNRNILARISPSYRADGMRGRSLNP